MHQSALPGWLLYIVVESLDQPGFHGVQFITHRNVSSSRLQLLSTLNVELIECL